MIVLIGATGNVGGEVAKQLAVAGQKARVIVRDAKRAEGLRQLGHEVVAADAENPVTIRPLIDSAEHLFFATSPNEHMAETHKKIIDTAKAAHVRHVVKISAMGATPTSDMRFGKLHGESDAALEQSGVPFTILRPNYFMQNFLSSAPTIRSDGAVYLPAGEAKISMVDVRDIGAVAVKTLTESGHEGAKYDITGPEALPGAEVAATLSAALGKPVKFVSPADDNYYAQLLKMGVPAFVAGGVREMLGIFRQGWGAQVSPDVERVIGRKPVSFEQFARDHTQVFLAGAAN